MNKMEQNELLKPYAWQMFRCLQDIVDPAPHCDSNHVDFVNAIHNAKRLLQAIKEAGGKQPTQYKP